MILFLNFAPLNFGGGAERWMLDVSSSLNKSEEITLVDVHSSISNMYGKLVLKRLFDQRIKIESNTHRKHISLKLLSFFPLTSSWREARNAFLNARLIYLRYELLEILILIYFGGFSIFYKSVAGIHSPFFYQTPLTLLDSIHNIVYSSTMSRKILSMMKTIHVLNPHDEKLFTSKFHLHNVVRVPNYVNVKKNIKLSKMANNKLLNIAFVGELNRRKGVDILINTIKLGPDNFIFHIAGDGPYRNEIQKLSKLKNVIYYGYLKEKRLSILFNNCDVLFQPSRAESFSLVAIEAMLHGLKIISSKEADLALPLNIQILNKDGIQQYINLFKSTSITNEKKNNIKKYAEGHFTNDFILPKLKEQIFVGS